MARHAFDSKGNRYPPTTAQKQKFCSMLVDHVMKFQSVVGSFFFATPPNKKQTLKKRKKTNENTGQRSLIDLGFTNGMNMKKKKTNSKNDQKKMKKNKKRKNENNMKRRKKSNLKRHKSDPGQHLLTTCYKHRGENWNPP